MHETRIEVNGEELLLDGGRRAVVAGRSARSSSPICISRKARSTRVRGQMLPPYDTRATIARIEALVARRTPARIIALGDSFHDPDAADRLDEEERARLAKLREGLDWIWIAGNHDPVPPHWLGGRVAEEIAIGGLLFRHEPQDFNARGEIAGHLHPCATVTRRGRSLAPPLLRVRRQAPADAGVRRLCRRPRRPRPRRQRLVQGEIPHLPAGRRARLCRGGMLSRACGRPKTPKPLGDFDRRPVKKVPEFARVTG